MRLHLEWARSGQWTLWWSTEDVFLDQSQAVYHSIESQYSEVRGWWGGHSFCWRVGTEKMEELSSSKLHGGPGLTLLLYRKKSVGQWMGRPCAEECASSVLFCFFHQARRI